MGKERIREALQRIVGSQNVLWKDVDLAVYEYDAGLGRGKPSFIAFAHDADQVAEIVKFLHPEGISYVARGSGTNLSGGTVPLNGGVVIELSRMNRILWYNIETRLSIDAQAEKII
jgi:glycolate oxidase